MQDLTTQLDRLSSQVRFVQMIIKKELSVSGRKKAEIVKDLKSKGFKTFAKQSAKVAADEGNQEVNEEEEEIDDTGSESGYDYLLTVRLDGCPC